MSLLRLQKLDYCDVETKILHFVSKLSEVAEIEEVILFGSAARQEMSQESDLDFAIVLDDNCDLKKLRSDLYRLKRAELDWSTDLLIGLKTSAYARKEIGGVWFDLFREGKVLFKRSEGVGYQSKS